MDNIIPNFYIFGVPDGFDMLGGTSAEISYFQKFYNGSKENTKFSIHRDVKGNITYSFLKYNLSSGKSRTGSFFGMSLVFQGVYVDNPLRLYALFEWVYDNYVVVGEKENKGFIIPIKGGEDIQARYDIIRFAEKGDYIKHNIESVLLANISKEFASHIHAVDSSFKSSSSILVAQEPMKSARDEKLLADLCHYNRVAVSPDWQPRRGTTTDVNSTSEAAITLAPEAIISLLDDTKRYQSYLIDSLNDIAAADVEKADRVYREVTSRLNEVKSTPSTDVRVSQIIKDYSALSEQLFNLMQKIKDSEDDPGSVGNSGSTENGSGTTSQTVWWKNIYFIGGSAFAAIILVLLIILFPGKELEKRPKPIYEPDSERIKAKVEKLIEFENYEAALQLVRDSLSYNDGVKYEIVINDKKITPRIDTLINTKHFSDAWEASENIKNESAKKEYQKTIKSKCDSHLAELVKNTATEQEAKNIKNRISGCKVPLEQDHINQWNKTLDSIIKPVSTVSATIYKIEIWKVGRSGQIDYDYNRKDNKHVIISDTEIEGTYFYYRLLVSTNNGSSYSPCGYQKADQILSVSDAGLKTHGKYDGSYKIEGSKGVITVKNGDKQFKITIK